MKTTDHQSAVSYQKSRFTPSSYAELCRKMSKGFSLMELLIVIAILGILATVGVSSFQSSQAKSRDSKRKNDLRQIALSLEAYYNDKGQYPAGNANGEIMGCYPDDLSLCTWGAAMTDKNQTVYMTTLPTEVKTNMRYYYIVGSTNKSFQLYARLENTKDSSIPQDAQNKARIFTDINCATTGTSYCNIGVASSNTSPEEGRSIAYE